MKLGNTTREEIRTSLGITQPNAVWDNLYELVEARVQRNLKYIVTEKVKNRILIVLPRTQRLTI